ncbi:MAG: hypothetical protein VX527_00885 [Planctomycetota bacterium]|nr:hypothetical protein [Planctomycetota bacterium]
MNVKRASVFAGTVGALVLGSYATAGFQEMAWHQVDNSSGPQGGNTYRIYALMDADNRLDAIAGNSSQNLSLSGNGGFVQIAQGGPTSLSINSGFFQFVPELEWDSYVTIGALHADGFPYGNNALTDVGIDWTDFEAGNELMTDNGTWFVTPDQEQGGGLVHSNLQGENGYIGDGYGTLIAQVTTNGDGGYFSGLVQGKDENGVTWQANVNDFAYGIPAPGALALLGLAGIAGRRRRRA